MKEELMKKCSDAISEVADLMNLLSEYRNEQWVLNFCDKLNQLSITY